MTQSDYDHREEGESLFEWPLDSAGCAWVPASYWTACSPPSSISTARTHGR